MSHRPLFPYRVQKPWRDRRGIAALEFGLVAPMLVLLLVGMCDYGIAIWEQMEVGNAARAGAAYASIHGWNSAAIENAAIRATELTSISAAASESLGCPSASQGVAPPSGSTCSGGVQPGTYVVVNATAQYSLIIPYPGLSGPLTLTGQATARIQ